MLKAIKRLPAVIIILCVLLNSCADVKRVAFASESGDFEIMLPENDWMLLESEGAFQLKLLHLNPSISFTIDHYDKKSTEAFGVSDFDGFIKFYKSIYNVKEVFENEKNTVENLLDIKPGDIKNKSFAAGKRQKINIDNPNYPNYSVEYIFFETLNYYFAVYYVQLDDFNKAQTTANDLLKHLNIIK